MINSFITQKLSKFIIPILFFASLSFVACETDDDDNMKDTKDGSKAAAFSLQDSEGITVSLSDYENKVVVLFFFGHACPSCRAVAPNVQRDLVAAYADRTEYQVLALDQWDGTQQAVQSFKQTTGLTIPTLQKAASTAKDYSTTYDRLVIIGKDGVVKFTGNQNVSRQIGEAKTIIDGLF